MTNHEIPRNPQEALLEAAKKNNEALGDTVLSAASEVRANTKTLKLTAGQVEALYSNMAELGFGREQDISLAEVGMAGAAVNIEGGKPNKILAELKVALAGDHGPIVLTASGVRQIGDDEKTILGVDSAVVLNELESAELVARGLEGFEPLDDKGAGVVKFGYNPLTKEVSDEDSGQARLIGHINGEPVYTLEVPRYYEEDGKYVQPNAGELTLLTAQMLKNAGTDVFKVATITGGLYGPTRSVDIIRTNKALSESGNPLVVGMAAYGRNTMGEITGTEPAVPLLGQLISEVSRLKALLSAVGEVSS